MKNACIRHLVHDIVAHVGPVRYFHEVHARLQRAAPPLVVGHTRRQQRRAAHQLLPQVGHVRPALDVHGEPARECMAKGIQCVEMGPTEIGCTSSGLPLTGFCSGFGP